MTHGLIRGGVSVEAGIDIESACRYPYEKNNAARFLSRDVETFKAEELSGLYRDDAIRLLAGCAPCQPFSSYSRSGRNKQYENQWPLVLAFGRLIRRTKPDLVTMENVPQLADHPVFEEFLTGLRGYKKWWKIVECTSLGVPQTRRRLVLLASRLGSRGLALPDTAGDILTVRGTIGHLPHIAAGEAYSKDPLHTSSALSEINLRRIQASMPGGSWRDWPEGLQAACHRKSSGATYPSVYGRMEWDKPAPTMTTQCFGYGNGRFGHPEQDRAISLREAAMLQTFPEDYEFTERSKPVVFSKLGRLIGNAVPVRLGEVIAETLVKHVQLYR